MKYYLACCDSDGRCFGFLRTDDTVSKDPDNEMDLLLVFKREKDANEKVLQINLSHMLMPNGMPFRVAIVRG